MTDVSAPVRIARGLARSPLKYLASVPRKVMWVLQRKLAGPASHSGFLASLYYTFLSGRFYREHRAVLAGKAEYLASNIPEKTSFGGFRRNVHRLEKALVMQPRRKTFAEAYIGETVDQFARAFGAASKIDAGEKKWAGDVLSLYFSVVGDTPKIAAARRRFEAIGYHAADAAPHFVPYARETVEPSGIAFEDLRRLFIARRSVRWFDGRPVSREILEQAAEAAGWAPSACNRQPYRFHAFTDPARAVEIAGLAGGTAGFVHNIPAIVVVVGDMSNFIEERDRHLIYIDGSLAAMQFMLALQVLGLSSVPINWPDVEEREIKLQAALKLRPYERPIMMIGVGYGAPSGLIPYSQKKPVALTLRIQD